MTPARLSEIQCPRCNGTHWIIDSDGRGMWLVRQRELSYPERTYTCRSCDFRGAGFQVLQQGPPAFFLQPHRLHPMSPAEFTHWVRILRKHFPHHGHLSRLGFKWYTAGSYAGRVLAFCLLAYHLLSRVPRIGRGDQEQ